ncbi:MAG TPA: DNA internalization-related competence protein ComEC/Rec2 [Mobilitalea sp.]|nr:DNA internalization-related competence protein ComEC/Rec2 [Mobilitalea sp.]
MIKRPLIWVLGAYLSGLIMAWYGVPTIHFILLILFGYITSFCLLSNTKISLILKKDHFLWCLPVLLALGFYAMGDRMEIPEADTAFDKEASCRLTGEVTLVIETKRGRTLHIRDIELYLSRGTPYPVENMIIYCSDSQNYLVGNKVTVSGTIQKFSPAANPGQFNEQMYYKIQNISYKMKADEIKIIDSRYSKYHLFLNKIKQKLLKVYDTILPDKESGALIAMLLGEKYLLEEDIKNLYQENGISHILAISGLHVSLIGASIYAILRRLKTGLLPATILSILFIYSYGVLTNFSVSTNRAVVMFIIMLLAKIFGKTYDMLSALSLCALLILLQNPLQFFSAGFLLSFGAVLGITILLPCIRGVFTIRNPMVDGILISISAQIMTLPMILRFFFQLPLYSVFINLLILPTMTLLVLSSLMAGIVGVFSLKAGVFLIGGANYLLKLYEWLCKLGSKLPGNLYTTGKPEEIRIIIFIMFLALFIWGATKYRKKPILLVLVTAVLILVLPKANHGLTITMLEVGQGEAIFMKNETGTTYLIDGGSLDIKQVGTYRLQPFLLSQGVDRIDYAIITHADWDHISGLTELIQGKKIEICNLVLPDIEISLPVTTVDKLEKSYLELKELAKACGVRVLYISGGDLIEEGKLQIHCLHPAKGYRYTSANSYSTVLSISYGKFDMLATGDIEVDGERLLIEWLMNEEESTQEQMAEKKHMAEKEISSEQMVEKRQIDVKGISDKRIAEKKITAEEVATDYDVLKVAHHGSKYSTMENFLEIIRPEYALISCGEDNIYGHPHTELIERLYGIGSRIMLTYSSGAITIKTDGSKLSIYEFLDKSMQ